MVTVCQAVNYAEDGIKVFAYSPGFTVSNLSAMNKLENGAKPVSEGTAPILNILDGERDAENGGNLHGSGQHPW